MTCIVGWIEEGAVWIGGDSAGVAGWDLTVRSDLTVFRNGPMLFGFTSSFRMGQLMRYALKIPHHDEGVDTDRYMATTFIDAVRSCLKDGGFAEKEKEAERGGVFLVGYRGRLFCIASDYQVGVPLDGYDAVGCGENIAKGSLYATKNISGRERGEIALAAAERHSAGVRGPFHIERLS